MSNEYTVYSKFDIDKHSEHFINYLEVIIDSKGEIYYAVPSHQMFMENLIKKEYGESNFYEMLIKSPESFDYLNWLCKTTKCISVWDDFYYGNPNSEQLAVLNILKNKRYKIGGSFLYRGSLKPTF